MTVHSCLAGPACRSSTGRQGATTITPNTLCPACNTHITNAIRQLPNDWAQLRNALGERSSTTGTKIRSTPTPAIPISTRREALMAAIVDMTDRAAAIVSNQLHTGQPATYHGRGIPKHPEHTVRVSVALVEPNINRLAQAPAEPMLIWAKPRRCHIHTRLIAAADDALTAATTPAATEKAYKRIGRAHAIAGVCDDCNGWGNYGQAREQVEMTGSELLLELVDLHNQARAELGHTRLRHTYTMPCPDCGDRVYRNDGESIVQCEGNTKHTRTEREYKVLTGLSLEERVTMAHHKFWLAEAYWRLDRLQSLVDKMTGDERVDLPGAGSLILEQLAAILTDGAPDEDGNSIPHQSQKQRATGTDKYSALQRQVDEDNWTWRSEKPYQKPKRKPRKATRQAGPLIEELVNPEQATNACRQCNLVHRGQCA